MSNDTLTNKDPKRFRDLTCLSIGAEKALEDLTENLTGNFVSSEQLGIATVFERALSVYYVLPRNERGPQELADAVSSATPAGCPRRSRRSHPRCKGS
jgi:hypothetical protein